MKKLLFLLTILFAGLSVYANGVCIVDADEGQYLRLLSSDVQVEVYNQIAITVATQTYKNEFAEEVNFKYAFPVPETGSATSLRWFINGQWNEAEFSAEPQDTLLPGGTGGGSNNTALINYLRSIAIIPRIYRSISPRFDNHHRTNLCRVAPL
jgi:hypothetical protein